MLDKIDRYVRAHYWFINADDANSIASEAWTLHFERYRDNLNDKSMQHIGNMVKEAARNMGFLPKKVNVGSRGSEKVKIVHRSFESMQADSGFDPAIEEAPDRPEFAVERVMNLLPEGNLKCVLQLLLDEQADSIEAAASAIDLPPRRVFDTLKRVGILVARYEEQINDGLFVQKNDEKYLRKSIARLCDTLFPRVGSVNHWEQGFLLAV